MAKLPRLSGKEVIEVFKRDGWVVDRIEGSHHILSEVWARDYSLRTGAWEERD